MSAIDFANSYMTWFPTERGNIARIQIDAACTLTDDGTGKVQTFYLIAPCRSERMYLDTQLFQMPNYEFCGIWSADEFVIIRTHWISDRDNRQYGLIRERWRTAHLDVRTFDQVDLLADDAQIVQATLDNRPLIARTEVSDPGRGLRAQLEYPIRTMNVMQDPPRFQVDTGPVILPDVASPAANAIERFDMAHVVYNVPDKAEFVLRRSVPIGDGGEGPSTTDYSEIRTMAARNQIVAAGMPAM